jgi:hypothetical protein
MARFVSIEGLEFAIMAVRWEHKTRMVSARDRAEQLLRSMPREKLAALHAGLNEGSLHTRALPPSIRSGRCRGASPVHQVAAKDETTLDAGLFSC